jgi:hypothetical protein
MDISSKIIFKEIKMKTYFRVSSAVAKNIRLILFIATLIIFVLAAGAPSATGTVGG